jgi:hypothetical protein
MVTVITLVASPRPCAVLAAAVERPGFNSEFYATAAAVIPVLYLALTVQGPMLPALLTRLHNALESMRHPRPGAHARPLKLAVTLMVAYATMTAAAIILAAGGIGEIMALLALAHRHDSAGTRMVVLLSVIGLLVFTAVGPLWALNTAWVRLQWIPLRTAWRALRPARPAAAPGPRTGGTSGCPEEQRPETPPSISGQRSGE